MQPKILIVEDEEVMQECYQKILPPPNHLITITINGKEALATASQENFDLALIDLKLPDIDGLELFKKIKALQPEILGIIITAFATVESAVAAMKGGLYDYIAKPFVPDELRIMVNRATEQIKLLSELSSYRSKGRIEESINRDIKHFYKQEFGRGPEDIQTHIISNMILIRLKGTLSSVEKKLSRTKEGSELVRQIGKELQEISKEKLADIIKQSCSCTVIESYSDINPSSGDTIKLFILSDDLETKIKSR